MTEASHLLEEKLKHIHTLIEVYHGHRSRAKHWCLTVWVAAFAITLTKGDNVPLFVVAGLLLVIIIIFWLLEAMYDGAIKLFYEYYNKIAKRVLSDVYKSPEIFEVDLYSGPYSKFSNKEKVEALCAGLFKTKTIVGFYLTLVVLSVVALFLLHGLR